MNGNEEVAKVTGVRSESPPTDLPEWEITVTRLPPYYSPVMSSPRASDVPPDVRYAIRKWLDTAE